MDTLAGAALLTAMTVVIYLAWPLTTSLTERKILVISVIALPWLAGPYWGWRIIQHHQHAARVRAHQKAWADYYAARAHHEATWRYWAAKTNSPIPAEREAAHAMLHYLANP